MERNGNTPINADAAVAAAATVTISDLPENVRIQIISYLPIKDAIATSFLSKAWRNLWTYSSNLFFDSEIVPFDVEEHESIKEYCKYTSFVDQALQRHNLSNLRFLRIHFPCCDEGLAHNIDKWIRIVAQNNVQHLDLRLGTWDWDNLYGPLYYLSFSHLRSATLTFLKLTRCCLLFSTEAGFCSLRTLILEEVDLTDQTIPDLVGGCPELENLSLHSCEGIGHLKIASMRLKNLSLRHPLLSPSSVEIDAPNLISFTCFYCDVHEFRFKDISSLFDAFVAIERYSDQWRKLVKSLTPARRITIRSWWGELMLPKIQHNEKSLPYHAKFLELSTGFTKLNFLGLALLLQHAPMLETVIVNMDFLKEDDERYKEKFLDEHFLHDSLPQLKVFWIRSYEETERELELEIELVKLLLKYCTALEEVILISRDESGFLSKRLEELLTFPRSSVHAKVSLVDSCEPCRDSVEMRKYLC